MTARRSNTGGFTLVEILVVVSIIAILIAILFPTFRSAQEKAHQASCITKLNQIAMAVKQYKLDQNVYPSSLVDISSQLGTRISGGKATAGKDSLVCPDDENFQDNAFSSTSLPYSSYFDNIGPQYVWNYYGYQTNGFAYTTDDAAYTAAMTAAGITDAKQYPRLYNRFAPDYTIITHCTYHRPKTGSNVTQQMDTVVRVDGSAKAIPWSGYNWVTQPN